MLYTENLFKGDESYDIRFNDKGDVTHAYFKDGDYIIFPTLYDFIRYNYMGEPDVERFYLDENAYDNMCEDDEYDYYKLKDKYAPEQVDEKVNNWTPSDTLPAHGIPEDTLHNVLAAIGRDK